MDAMWWIIWSTVIFTAVVLSIVWFLNKLIFKHKVRVIELGKENLELDFKARDYNKEGVLYWQLDKERSKELKNMPIPPAGAINIAKRGKKSVTCFRTPTGEYIFLGRDNVNLNNIPNLNKGIPKEILDLKDEVKKAMLVKRYQQIQLKKWRLDNKGILLEGTHQPFTSKQRMVIVNNFEKAKTRKGFSLKEHIPMMVSMGAMVILIVCLMIFWGDIAKPALEARAMTKEIVDVQLETIEILREIRLGQQTIEAEQGGG